MSAIFLSLRNFYFNFLIFFRKYVLKIILSFLCVKEFCKHLRLYVILMFTKKIFQKQ